MNQRCIISVNSAKATITKPNPMAMLDKKLGANDRHRMEGDNNMPKPSMRNKRLLTTFCFRQIR